MLPRHVTCPRCGAQPWCPCRDNGVRRFGSHKERYAARDAALKTVQPGSKYHLETT